MCCLEVAELGKKMDRRVSCVLIFLFHVSSSTKSFDVGLRNFTCSYFGFGVSLVVVVRQTEIIDSLNAKCSNGTLNYEVRLHCCPC